MNKRKFIGITGGTIISTGITAYVLSDRSNFVRADLEPKIDNNKILKPDEREILFLASLAPSGHNTQPWLVQYLAPYHWIIGNDQSKFIDEQMIVANRLQSYRDLAQQELANWIRFSSHDAEK
jgi:nitroreductase